MSTYADEVLADTPIAYWRLGEATGDTAVDASGSADGGYVNNPTLADLRLAYGFDRAPLFLKASDQHVTAAGVATLTGATGWTMEAWVRPTGIVDAVTHYTVVSLFSYFYMRLTLQTSIRLQVGWRDSTAVSRALTVGSGVDDVQNDTTRHVVATHDGTTARLYIDGVERAATSSWNAQDEPSSTSIIGRRSGVDNWNGHLGEVALYDHALSPARIAAHVAATAPRMIRLTGAALAVPALTDVTMEA